MVVAAAVAIGDDLPGMRASNIATVIGLDRRLAAVVEVCRSFRGFCCEMQIVGVIWLVLSPATTDKGHTFSRDCSGIAGRRELFAHPTI